MQEDGTLAFPAGMSGDVSYSNGISFRPGIYDITVSYKSGGADCSIRLTDSTIRAATVALRPEVETVTFQAWVSTATDEAVLRIFTGGSSLELYQIEYHRNLGYSWYLATILVVVFFCVDLLGLFWSGGLYFASEKGAVTAVGLGAIVFLASMPLLVRNMVPGIDILFHLFRIEGITESLQAGQFPVRMQAFWLDGRGYPLSVFYGDAFLYFSAALRFLGFSIQSSYKALLILCNAATAGITYWCLQKIVKNEVVALTGTALYTLSIYRLVDMYVRAALGETLAMTFYPLVFYGLWTILSQKNGEKPRTFLWLPATIGFTGLIQSHMLSCEIAGLLTIAVCLIYAKRVFRKNTFFPLCKVVGATALLNAWFLLPFLDYYTHGKYRITEEPGYSLEDNAAFIGQLFGLNYSAQTNRYSLGLNSGTKNEMAMGLGLAFLVGIVLYVGYRLKTRAQGRTAQDRLANFSILAAAVCVLLSVDVFPWGNLLYYSTLLEDFFGKLQFSWRFLGAATLFLTVLAVCALRLVEKNRLLKIFAMAAMLGCTVITWGTFSQTALTDNSNMTYYSAADLYSQPFGNGDYLPEGLPDTAISGKREATADGVTLTQVTTGPLWTAVSCSSQTGGTVTVPQVYYLYYQAVDAATGKTLAVDQNPETYLVRVMVPQGYDGTFTVRFCEPLSWRAAEALSALTLLATTAAFLHDRKRNRKNEAEKTVPAGERPPLH